MAELHDSPIMTSHDVWTPRHPSESHRFIIIASHFIRLIMIDLLPDKLDPLLMDNRGATGLGSSLCTTAGHGRRLEGKRRPVARQDTCKYTGLPANGT